MSPKMSLVGTYLIAGEDVFEVDSDCIDCDLFDRLEEVAPDYDIEYLSYDGNKLFGYPTGGNIPDVNTKTHLLFQYSYNVGCLWNIFWIISDEDLKNRNFDKAVFSFDLD